MPKQKLISNLDRTRWVSLSKIREFTIWEKPSCKLNAWKVSAWLNEHQCFICFEAPLQRDAITWVEELNK